MNTYYLWNVFTCQSLHNNFTFTRARYNADIPKTSLYGRHWPVNRTGPTICKIFVDLFDFWEADNFPIIDEAIHTACELALGSFIRYAHSLTQEHNSNIWFIIDNLYYLLYNIMGEYYYYIYLYLSPLIILYFYKIIK